MMVWKAIWILILIAILISISILLSISIALTRVNCFTTTIIITIIRQTANSTYQLHVQKTMIIFLKQLVPEDNSDFNID